MCENGCECVSGNAACEDVSLGRKLLSMKLCVCVRVWLLSLMTVTYDSVCVSVSYPRDHIYVQECSYCL